MKLPDFNLPDYDDDDDDDDALWELLNGLRMARE